MLAGLVVVAILLWIASILQQKPASEPVGTTGIPATLPVAASGDIYIAGHIHHSGMLTLRPGEKIKDVINDAGGGDSPAADLIVRIVRKDGDTSTTHSHRLADVLSGTDDEKVKQGDLIDVVLQVKPTTLQIPAVGTPPMGEPTTAP
jgi:protein involved in polysaccharide export with SLBB domain